LFDVRFYQKQLGERTWSRTSLEHYLQIGFREGFDPHPLFSSALYLQENEYVHYSGTDPLTHFLSEGHTKTPSPHPLFDVAFFKRNKSSSESDEIAFLSFLKSVNLDDDPHPLFSTRHYMSQVPGQIDRPAKALEHYFQLGWRQGLNPHPLFD